MKNYLYFILCLVLYGCNTESTVTKPVENIELSADILDYPYLDESNIKYEIIQLKDGAKESIVPDISEIIEYKDRIYILTPLGPQNSVLIFNIDGSYITSLQQGRARNEFLSAIDIYIDSQNNQLEILDRGACAVLSYSLDGEFISKRELPRKNMSEFLKISNSQYLIHTPVHTYKDETDTYFKRIENGKIVQEYLDKPKGLKNLSMGWNMSTSNNNIYCYGTYGNMCYKFNKETLCFDPLVQILPVLDLESKYIKGDMYTLKNHFYIFTNFRALCNESLLAFSVRKDTGYSVMYNKRDKKLYQHIFSDIQYLGHSLIGHNDNDEFFFINAANIEVLKDSGTKSKVAQRVIDDLMNKDLTATNPYIIRVSYTAK